MSLSAVIFMLAVWAIVLGSTGYCFRKLLTSGRRLDEEE